MAPHSSTLAWKIPWMEEPGRLQSMGSLRVRHDWVTSLSLFTFLPWRRKWQPIPAFLPGESQGRGSLVGCHLWGRRVGHDWSDLAAAAAATEDMRFYSVGPLGDPTRTSLFLTLPQESGTRKPGLSLWASLWPLIMCPQDWGSNKGTGKTHWEGA